MPGFVRTAASADLRAVARRRSIDRAEFPGASFKVAAIAVARPPRRSISEERGCASSTPREPMVRRFRTHEFTPRILASQLAIVVLLAASLAGCARSPRASVAQLWDRVPSWRWTSSDTPPEEPVAPKVTANVAVVAVSDETSSEAATSDDPFVDNPAQALAALPDLDHEDPDSSAETQAGEFAWLTAAPDVPPADQRVHDLKAALHADAARQQSPVSAPTGPHPLRLRVDGLLRKAIDQLAAGQPDEARRTAQLAVDLSNTAGLEFLPNEDRPSDLLREIDEQLAARRAPPREPAETPATSPQLPAIEPGPIAALPPASRLIPAVQEAAAGTMAANFPLSVRSARDKEPVDDAEPHDEAIEPAVATVRMASVEAPVAFNRQSLWTAPELDPSPSPAPQVAPKPPMIDEIEPLPSYRDSLEVAPPPQDAPLRATSLHWSDWLSVAAMLTLLAACGLALFLRRWWQGH
jgi:hypothetical protein